MVFGCVFDFGLVFCVEKLKICCYLIEFWMMDVEYLYLIYDELFDL